MRQYCDVVGEVKEGWVDLLSEPEDEIVKVKLAIEVIEDVGELQFMAEKKIQSDIVSDSGSLFIMVQVASIAGILYTGAAG